MNRNRRPFNVSRPNPWLAPALLLAFAAPVFTAQPPIPPIPPVPDEQPKPPFAATEIGPPRMLVPGFTIRELPVKLPSLNNIEYAPDGRLFAGGYNGRFHLLRDTDGDGLENKVTTFSVAENANYPLGIVVKDGDPHFVLTDEIVRFRDTDGDGVPDKRETVFKGFDDPALVAAPYLNHRRVDSSMALAYAPDGSWYVSMGNAGYNNPYWHDGGPGKGTPQYRTDKRRGCLLRFTPDGKVEQLISGLRYIMSLQFNKHGDLFGTDQEGATWCPNGNPFDELLHLQPGRHYGFPPSHPKFLADVVDEPSVWNYAPQHQSTCGFRFNTPGTGRGRFGPASWEDNAIVTSMTRGNLWRTALAKTAAGYVARTELFARMGTGLLPVDCTISPQGDLLVACHTGSPDWGNGPQGDGHLFKISLTGKTIPQPVLAWAASDTQTVIAFDRELPADFADGLAARTRIESGRYVAAGDDTERTRLWYKVVTMQRRQPRTAIAVKSARLGDDRRSLVLDTAADAQNLPRVVKVGDHFELAYRMDGALADWRGAAGAEWSGWLPHPDLTAAREFTRDSATHDELWQRTATAGTLTLRGQLDLWNTLQPATQPTSELDYTPAPEQITVRFRSDAALKVEVTGAAITRVSEHESHVTITDAAEGKYKPFTLTLATPATALDVSFTNTRDAQTRPLGVQRFVLPFARPGSHDEVQRDIPEIAGGNWAKGRELFAGKAACFTCHILHGVGTTAVGPDLNTLVHRDYASVLRDITDPSAIINPDAVGYIVTMKDDTVITGTRFLESTGELHIAQPGGQIAKLKKAEIATTEPMKISLMPAGLDKALSPAELRDLMSFLMTEKPATRPK